MEFQNINVADINGRCPTPIKPEPTVENQVPITLPDGKIGWIDVATLLAALTPDFWRSGEFGTLLPDGTGNDPTTAITHQGWVGIGTTPSAALHVSGSVVFTGVDISDHAADDDLGLAGDTVDQYSTLRLLQETPGINLHIPNPSDISAQGRRLVVINGGNVDVTLYGITTNVLIAVNYAQEFVWYGSWYALQ